MANILGTQHDIDSLETRWKLQGVPYIVAKLHERWSTNGLK